MYNLFLLNTSFFIYEYISDSPPGKFYGVPLYLYLTDYRSCYFGTPVITIDVDFNIFYFISFKLANPLINYENVYFS